MTRLNYNVIVSYKLKEKEIMEKTIELIDEQHAALVQVIQFLDSHKHSNEPVREAVDKVLNHSDELYRDSEMELTRISLK